MTPNIQYTQYQISTHKFSRHEQWRKENTKIQSTVKFTNLQRLLMCFLVKTFYLMSEKYAVFIWIQIEFHTFLFQFIINLMFYWITFFSRDSFHNFWLGNIIKHLNKNILNVIYRNLWKYTENALRWKTLNGF